jgi:PAS domain S-box-containing protein
MPNLGQTPEADHRRLQLLSMALRIGSFGYFVQEWANHKLVWSPETYRIWGVAQTNVAVNHDWVLSTLHPDDVAPVLAWHDDLSWKEKVADFRIFRPDGAMRHIRAHIERERDGNGNVRLAYGFIIDQTERRQAETALQHSEARFESLFETSGAGFVITASDARILFINTAFAKLLGYTPSELLGKSIRDLSPTETKVATFDMVNAMRAGHGQSRDVEKPYTHRNGTLVWARLTINLHTNAAGKEEFIGVIQDLTDRHRTEERLIDSENLLNMAQSIGKIGHWVWWPDSGAVEWSEELCRIVGYPTDQRKSRDQRMRGHVHPDDLALYLSALDQLMIGGIPQSLEFRVVRRDGVVRNVIGRSMPLEKTPEGARMVGTIQDITESKSREEALRRETLKAEAANRAKTLFLANMSHELRTPLNAILGFGQLLAMGTKGALNADQKSYVENVVRGGEHLLRLISDVLDLARIDSGHFQLSMASVNLNQACSDVIEGFSKFAAERNIMLKTNFSNNTPYIIHADRVRVTQVLMNLVSNAVKYNRDSGEVMIEITTHNDSWVRVSVGDTGKGIPWDRQAEVFQHFNRLGAESHAVEGSGIGLALSKRLVEEMNGQMGFKSEPNVYTLFWFDLPTAPADAHAYSIGDLLTPERINSAQQP